MVIISPRRMGKTGLIQFCYEKPELKEDYYTFFIDIFSCRSDKEFYDAFASAILKQTSSKFEEFTENAKSFLTRVSPKFSVGTDPMTDFSLSLEWGSKEAEVGEILQLPEKIAQKKGIRIVICIDEFQQIAKYPEKNIEALLRTHIQKIKNSHFIFAGSERSMMQDRSADVMELNAIEKDIYIPFIVNHFETRNRKISRKDVEKVYDLFKGHTYYIQKTFNESFADTPPKEECTLEIIRTAIDNLIAYNDTIFREILSNIPDKQKELLYAIAREDEAKQILSANFIKRHSLPSASSVQASIKKLLGKDIVTDVNKTYSVTDKLFAMWINKIYSSNQASRI